MTKETKRQLLEIIAIVALAGILVGSGFWIGWTEGQDHSKNIVVSEATNITPNASAPARSPISCVPSSPSNRPRPGT